MQSTGHSSTQPLSLTSTHGSAITYVMGGSPRSVTAGAPGGLALTRLGPLTGWLASRRCVTSPPSAGPAVAGCGGGGVWGGGGGGGARRRGAVCRGARGWARVGGGAPRAAQVVPGGCEQAGIELAVGGQPDPGAAAAKRLGDRGDHADLAGAVPVPVAGGDLPGVGGRDRLDGPLAADLGDDLGSGD